MEKILRRLPQGLLLILLLISSACKREKLDEVWSNEQFPAVNIGMDNRLEIGQGSNYTLTGGYLVVPVTINFSGPTSRAFMVNLVANTDTVSSLISAGLLDHGTIAIEQGGFIIPSTLSIPIGVNNFTFDMNVSRSFVEKNYGKDIAVGLKIVMPSKGNSVASAKNSSLVIIKTNETLSRDKVHYISFGSDSFTFAVPQAGNYEIGSETISISVPIVLGGDAGPAFNVAVSSIPDTIGALVGAGKLSNVEALGANAFSIPPTVRFVENSNIATLNFEIHRNRLLSIKNKNAVVILKLSNPEKYQLDGDKKTIAVVIDQDFFRPFNGTPFIINGTIGVTSEPIYAAYFDFGGPDVAYKDDATKNGILTHRPEEMVDFEDLVPATAVGYVVAGEWLTFSVLVEETGTYEMIAQVSSTAGAGRYNVQFGTTNVTGTVSVLNTTAYAIYRDQILSVKLTKGRHIMRVNFTTGGMNYKGLIFTRKS
jgi:hypothetical protein